MKWDSLKANNLQSHSITAGAEQCAFYSKIWIFLLMTLPSLETNLANWFVAESSCMCAARFSVDSNGAIIASNDTLTHSLTRTIVIRCRAKVARRNVTRQQKRRRNGTADGCCCRWWWWHGDFYRHREKEFVIGHRRKYGNAFIAFHALLIWSFGHRDRGRFCVVCAAVRGDKNLRNDFCQSITGLRSATRAVYPRLLLPIHSFIETENPNTANGNSFILSVKRIIRHKCHPPPCDNAQSSRRPNCKQQVPNSGQFRSDLFALNLIQNRCDAICNFDFVNFCAPRRLAPMR